MENYSEIQKQIHQLEQQVKICTASLEEANEQLERVEAERRKDQEQLENLEKRIKELMESEARYRSLFDGVPVGLYRTTPSGKVMDANPAAWQMLGYASPRDGLQAGLSTIDVYMDPTDHDAWKALMAREGVVRYFEVQLQRSDGTLIWVSDTARAVKDNQGKVLYYEGCLEDITERKRFEDEIHRQKEYYEALFFNSPAAVVTTDFAATVVSWNPMAEKLFGYTEREVLGQKLDDLLTQAPTLEEESLGYTQELLTAQRMHTTTRHNRKDGSLVDVEVLAVPVIVAGKQAGFIMIYHDISELQEARRAAEAANKAKSTFLANMSHELRTPLNAIIGFTRLVRRHSEEILPKKQLDNLDKVLLSADRLLSLINTVLELAKIEAGRVIVRPIRFELDSLISACFQTVQPLTKHKELMLLKDVDTELPALFTDRDKLQQILINLLSNAIKFTEAGTITVTTRLQADTITIAVTDTGIGIPEEALGQIFEVFHQVDGSTTRQYSGTGMGLTISRQLARLLGGDVTMESTVGVGSTCTVCLPLHYAGVPTEITTSIQDQS